jgi:hypothetical protein
MKRKRRKIFRTPEERAAWEAHFEMRQRELQARIEKLDAELAAHGRKRRGLEYWIERHKAERAAREQAST